MTHPEPTNLREPFVYNGPQFENCKTVNDILQTIVAMQEAGDTLGTHKLTGQQLARSLDRVAQATRNLRADPMYRGELPSADEIDQLLATNGITSQGGLREIVQTLVVRHRRLKFHGEDYTLLDKAIGRGAYHPVYLLAQRDPGTFIQQYPETWFAEHRESTSDDTEEIIAARLAWQEHEKKVIHDRGTAQQANETAWLKNREGIVLPAEAIVDPSSTDNFSRYSQYQAEVTAFRKTEEARRSGRNFTEISYHVSLVDRSVGDFVSKMMKQVGEANGPVQYTDTLLKIQSLRGEELEIIGRTLRLPLDDKKNDIVITLLSNTSTERVRSYTENRDVPVENATSIRGVIIESIGEINLSQRKLPSTEDTAMLSSAYRVCSQLEDDVLSRTGLNLGLRKRLQQLAQEMGLR